MTIYELREMEGEVDVYYQCTLSFCEAVQMQFIVCTDFVKSKSLFLLIYEYALTVLLHEKNDRDKTTFNLRILHLIISSHISFLLRTLNAHIICIDGNNLGPFFDL